MKRWNPYRRSATAQGALQGGVNIGEEFLAQAGALTVIPEGGLGDVVFSESLDEEGGGHGRSLSWMRWRTSGQGVPGDLQRAAAGLVAVPGWRVVARGRDRYWMPGMVVADGVMRVAGCLRRRGDVPAFQAGRVGAAIVVNEE